MCKSYNGVCFHFFWVIPKGGIARSYERFICKSRFSSLSTTAILDHLIPYCRGLYTHCTMFSIIPALIQLDCSSTHCQSWESKIMLDIAKYPLRSKISSQLRVTALLYKKILNSFSICLHLWQQYMCCCCTFNTWCCQTSQFRSLKNVYSGLLSKLEFAFIWFLIIKHLFRAIFLLFWIISKSFTV